MQIGQGKNTIQKHLLPTYEQMEKEFFEAEEMAEEHDHHHHDGCGCLMIIMKMDIDVDAVTTADAIIMIMTVVVLNKQHNNNKIY